MRLTKFEKVKTQDNRVEVMTKIIRLDQKSKWKMLNYLLNNEWNTCSSSNLILQCVINRSIPNIRNPNSLTINDFGNKEEIMGSSHHGKKYFISLGTNRDTNWPSILNTRSSSQLQIDSTVSGGRKACLKLHKRTLKHKWTLCWEVFLSSGGFWGQE